MFLFLNIVGMLENNVDNIYSKFPKVSAMSNRDYMSNAYGTKEKVQYYNDPEKGKKKKTKYIATLALVGISTFGALIAAFGYRKGKFDPSKIKSTAEKVSNTLNDKKIVDKLSNAITNFVNVKDDIWAKFSKKIENNPLGKIINKFNNSTTNFNKYKLVKPSCKGQYDKACGNLAQHGGKDFEEFDKLFTSLDEAISTTLHKKNNRVTDGLLKDGTKGFADKFTKSIIADDKINSLDAVKAAYKEIPKGASKELESAINEYNEMIYTMVSKLRDINCGSAPTDYMTMIGSAGALGIAAANADDKKERRSILVELGIPLISTLGCSFIANAKLLSGAVGLLTGFIVGKTASVAAAFGMKKYDKFISANFNNENNQNV